MKRNGGKQNKNKTARDYENTSKLELQKVLVRGDYAASPVITGDATISSARVYWPMRAPGRSFSDDGDASDHRVK